MGNSFLTPKVSAPSTEPVLAPAFEPETLSHPYACKDEKHAEGNHTMLCRFVANLKA